MPIPLHSERFSPPSVCSFFSKNYVFLVPRAPSQIVVTEADTNALSVSWQPVIGKLMSFLESRNNCTYGVYYHPNVPCMQKIPVFVS